MLKKSILIAISNYGDGQIPFLIRQIAELRKLAQDFQVTICVHSTVNLDIPDIHVIECSPSLKLGLTFKHRSLFVKEQNNYDVFLYAENDILITRENILAYLDVTSQLPDDYITGFIRYEIKDGKKYLPDVHPNFPTIEVGLHKQNKLLVFALANLHSGCYILTKKQLKKAIASKQFAVRPHGGPLGILEQGASDVYTQCGFRRKILPFDFEPLLVHHMPDKYVALGGIWSDPGTHTVESLKQALSSHDYTVELCVMNKNKRNIFRRVLSRLQKSLRNPPRPMATPPEEGNLITP